jgi:hypothetical protein
MLGMMSRFRRSGERERVGQAQDHRGDSIGGGADQRDRQVAEHVARGGDDDPLGDLVVALSAVAVEQAADRGPDAGRSISRKSVMKVTETASVSTPNAETPTCASPPEARLTPPTICFWSTSGPWRPPSMRTGCASLQPARTRLAAI